MKWALAVFLLGCVSKLASAQSTEQRFDDTFASLAGSSRFSLFDGGGSKGTYGTTVGIGIAEAQVGSDAGYANSILGLPSTPSIDTSRRWINVTAMRGTPWPLDVGVAVSQLQGSTTSQVAGIIQSTVFEELSWPAATIRYSYCQLVGLRGDNTIAAQTAELLMTQGIWRYFSGYISGGYEQTNISITISNEDTLGLNDADELSGIRTVRSPLLRAGLQISAWPPFFQILGEATTNLQQQRQFGIKINWLI